MDKKCGENNKLKQSVEPSETKTALEKWLRWLFMPVKAGNKISRAEKTAPKMPIFFARQPIFQESDWQYMLQQDQVSAFAWLQQAADQGEGVALNMLGRCYEHGWGTAINEEKAFSCYGQSAKKGDIWALFNLADCYRKGVGCTKDACRAVELYQQAAAQGHIKSLNMLGLAYEEGSGVVQDLVRAAQYFAQGAKLGDCWASFNHARLLASKGEKQESFDWLERSLTQQSGDYCQTIAHLFSDSQDKKLRHLAHRAKEIAQTGQGGL